MKQAASHSTDRMERIFSDLIDRGVWKSDQSQSGTGSDLAQTTQVRKELPSLLRSLGVDTLLDIPCGDFNWMRHVSLPLTTYIGADVVPALVETNQRQYTRVRDPEIRFTRLDITRDLLPQVDVILCRDCLVHFSYADIRAALGRIIACGSTYLLTTVFTASHFNRDITTGEWRQLNLMLPPFSLPPPLEIINEGCTEARGNYADKSLGLWRIADLTSPVP